MARLVVGGIGAEYQASMAEMKEAMKNEKCLVLFPAENANVFHKVNEEIGKCGFGKRRDHERGRGWDVIVIDGTWSQARKLYSRYIPLEKDGGPTRVQLSDEALALLSTTRDSGEDSLNDRVSPPVVAGHQLRRHPIQWKAISTLEATRLLMNDMAGAGGYGYFEPVISLECVAIVSTIADNATRTQLGPHR